MAKKKQVRKAKTPPSPAAVAAIRSAFADRKAMGEYELDKLVDIITSSGTAPEALSALQALPPREPYAFARIMLLRRMWRLGRRFLLDSWMREKFAEIRLTVVERRKMVLQFGEDAVEEFLKTPYRRTIEGQGIVSLH
jgi:hypothetical protein